MTIINPYFTAMVRADKNIVGSTTRNALYELLRTKKLEQDAISVNLYVGSGFKGEKVMTGAEAFKTNLRFRNKFSKEIQKEIDSGVPFGYTTSVLKRWTLKEKNTNIPMKQKQKNKKTASAVLVTAPKIKMSKQMSNLVCNQADTIASVLNGTAYTEKNRWHGKTSVYDTLRISKFLNNCEVAGSIDMKRYTSLSKEIPTFHKAIGPNLSRMIAAAQRA